MLIRLIAFHSSQQAKLGAAVAIVQSGIEVIISKCGSTVTEKFIKGDWDSVWDIEAGTQVSQLSAHFL